MRDYSKVSPRAWHGSTFKSLRRDSKGLVVGLYLLTSPSSNMLGLYSQPVLYMAHETGLGEQGALEGLQRCIEAGFCSYDEESEMVWVHEMASYQVGDELKPTDLRCKGIQKDYDNLPANPFLGQFFDRYVTAFNLTRRRESEPQTPVDNQAPCKPLTKPLRSQEQEQETEQEIEKEDPPASRVPPLASARPSKKCPTSFVITPELRQWAREKAPNVNIDAETETLRDHTFATARSDWAGTWRNWMRKAAAARPGFRPAAGSDDPFAGAH